MKLIKNPLSTKVYSILFCNLFLFSITLNAQRAIYDSGGVLSPEQAAYDVKFYDLTLAVDPTNKYIKGELQVNANIVQPIHYFVMDLDTLLEITKIEELVNPGFARQRRKFERRGGYVWIDLGLTRQPNATVRLHISYQGHPRVAPHAPWDGGFTWSKTSQGADWIATTCQEVGADVWWPCKDHVSDEPDSMALHITVPDPLVVASNGRLRNVVKNDNNTSTYNWFVSTPINIYDVALNIAPYQLITSDFKSVDGTTFPVQFWVLPEDYEKGKKFFPEIIAQLKFFEEYFGPYPFRADKYGAVQTPHLGMEHQTIIAYGANFSNTAMTGGKDWGFDALHHHELSHEWWGNLVTNASWEDMWLHEGFATYMQALYSEKLFGKERYFEYMRSQRRFGNRLAVAPRKTMTAAEIYRAPIYTKGAWVLHSLRYLLGDESFFRALRLMAYPNPQFEEISDGHQCRFATTDDFQSILETVSGMNLDWFFDVYLRQAKLPKLIVEKRKKAVFLKWESPLNNAFPMPVEIEIGGKLKRFVIPQQGIDIPLKKETKYNIDPQGWLLFE